ncbi:TetR/AcrR family transcriptional regulator C-terminal domain-containing protein [Dactylosporangium aurantiacum]|uniref:TetR/AcrR family transcriptional regulator C-terminal domain-containing protein n=1 Tax=Dactylosporangium aurantiacum TaxID=35754 RepID=A0A9Q9IAK2_9ACTN|nr:TetR/AcrR family transcriptional regulator C-terminal domain-containing protein [Dactylosporangium aurantiacum]MDG6104965.1 TetR/AcrR family transcriptional regulator C-terminal domain-containing protein [Dactylosporangium aurantiacum]UWZ51501.1 TetR/AcrR family transcriptional regulator C-terminal domain-containing protein [Dactylosporangium aurantiacum]
MARTSGPKQPRDMAAALALLWDETERPTRGPKPSLDPRRIADAAVAIADADGLDAVSMARVAGVFNLSGMALYRYVPGRDELVALMVEAILTDRPDLSGAGNDWRAQLTAWARQSWAVHQAHPWLLPATAMRRQAMGPHQIGWMDAAIAALQPTGLTAAQQHQVFLLVAGLVRNLAQQQLDFDEAHAREWSRLNGELLARHADRFPALTKAILDGAFTPIEDPLAFGLDRLFDGVQALIDRARTPG